MNPNRMRVSFTLILLVLMLSACASYEDPNWAEPGVRKTLQSQVMDPAAGARNGTRVGTTEGRNVREAIERHGEAFKAVPAAPALSVGTVGGN